MLNLSVILEDSARRYPDKVAFTFMDTDYTYARINEAANRVAHGLKNTGIGPGDKVALSCLNIPYFPIIYFGILKAGAVVVPLSVLLKKDEIAYHLSDSEAKAYCCFVGNEQLPMGQMGYQGFQAAPNCRYFFLIMPQPDMPSPIEGTRTFASLVAGQSPLAESYPTHPDDTAVIVYTSGTTGTPKGAELTHIGLLTNAILTARLEACSQQDTAIIVLPLFHIFAMTCQMNAGIYVGLRSILQPRFDAKEVLQHMLRHKVTMFTGVPTMYWGLVNCQDESVDIESVAKNLRICISGGASLPLQVLKDFEARFQVKILEGYGMSEGSPVVTFNHLDIGRKPGSIGTSAWGVEVKIVDEHDHEVAVGEKGELIYHGPNVMKGYYQRPEETARALRNGWMHSGDVAVRDEDGFFYIVDRTTDMIIRGGFNVYPREVEEVMIRHEAVSLVAVIGIPDERLGEEIKAFVVLKENQSVAAEELIQWTKERIADYKYPRTIAFVKSLPMSATGKILKKDLPKDRDR